MNNKSTIPALKQILIPEDQFDNIKFMFDWSDIHLEISELRFYMQCVASSEYVAGDRENVADACNRMNSIMDMMIILAPHIKDSHRIAVRG